MANRFAFVAALLFIACAQPRGPASIAMTEQRAGARDAGADANATDPGRAPNRTTPSCPEDCVWTGSVCQGGGYVTCPAGMHLAEGPAHSVVRGVECAPSRDARAATQTRPNASDAAADDPNDDDGDPGATSEIDLHDIRHLTP